MAELVAAIRGGNDELKKQLPFRCALYYQFRDNRRSQKNITPERILFNTDKASEIYRSPHWYEVLPQEELKKRRQAYLDRELTIDGRGVAVSAIQF